MAFLEYLKAFRRRWILVAACFVLATAIGYIVSPEEPSEPSGAGFEASQTLVVNPEVTTSVNLFLAANLATGPDVVRLAAEKLPAGVAPATADAVTAGVDTEAGALIVSVTGRDQTTAGLNVEALSAATIEFFGETTTQTSDDALESTKAELETIAERLQELEGQQQDDPTNVIVQAQIDSERTQYSILYQRIQTLTRAEDPPPPLQVLGTPTVTELDAGLIQAPDDRRVRALLVGAVGLLLGLGLAITVDRLDSRLRERDEVEDAFGLPVLAEIPTVGRRARADHALITDLRPDSAAAEGYRSLRSAITLVTQSGYGGESAGGRERPPQAAPQVLVVTGADGSQGKSTTVVNLAAVIAESGRSVIVIDCDFRKPEAHQFLDGEPRSRLADLVTGFFSGYLDQMLRPTAVRGVELVSSIAPVADHTSAVARLPGLIAEARERADVVLIDSSPLLITSDAVDVLRYADAALVACRVGRIAYSQAIRARRLLQRADVKVLGVVLTGTPRSHRTPYGQPTRRQRLLTKVGSWSAAPGPDRFDTGDVPMVANPLDSDANPRESGERSRESGARTYESRSRESGERTYESRSRESGERTHESRSRESGERTHESRSREQAPERQRERGAGDRGSGRPIQRHVDRASGSPVPERAAEPMMRERQSPEPVPTWRTSSQADTNRTSAAGTPARPSDRTDVPASDEHSELEEPPTMEFSTVDAAAAAAAAASSATHYRTSRAFEDRAEAAARKLPNDRSSD